MVTDFANRTDLEIKAVTDFLMDPSRDHRDMDRETFDGLLAKREIREEVATRILGRHVRKNQEFNEQNPVSIPYEISFGDVKWALQDGVDIGHFVAFRDCKMTIDQLKMVGIFKKTGRLYKTVDDLRESADVDPAFLVKPRHSGPVFRFYHGQAKSLGRDQNNGYNGFMINEISNHGVMGIRCSKSLLSRKELLKLQSDEVFTKSLLKK